MEETALELKQLEVKTFQEHTHFKGMLTARSGMTQCRNSYQAYNSPYHHPAPPLCASRPAN